MPSIMGCDEIWKGVNMRPKKRIRPMLKLIREIWEAYPDFKLGQIIVNATFSSKTSFPYDSHLYGLEDDKLYEELEQFKNKITGGRRG